MTEQFLYSPKPKNYFKMCVAYNPMDSTRNLHSGNQFQSLNNKNDDDLNINLIIDSKIEIDHVTEDMYVLKDLRQPTMTSANKNNSEQPCLSPFQCSWHG